MLSDCAVLVPAYNPNGQLLELAQGLKGIFGRLLVVDDGSTSGVEVFAALEKMAVTVLRHGRNCGKGQALKTGFAWILDAWPGVKTVVTADADGQHRLQDIEAIAKASLAHPFGLTLGVRVLGRKVPFRSMWGNWWTRQVFWLMTSLRVKDTQTGLRGIPAALLPQLLKYDGVRYEYEMQMLADAVYHREKPLQLPIETIYIDNNSSSHFCPLRDTFRIYGALFRFVIARFSRRNML